MKAVGKYIVIDPVKETQKQTKGGLILGEKQREDIRYREAKVLVVGEAVDVVKKMIKYTTTKQLGLILR